jgi:hypothetical protein
MFLRDPFVVGLISVISFGLIGALHSLWPLLIIFGMMFFACCSTDQSFIASKEDGQQQREVLNARNLDQIAKK